MLRFGSLVVMVLCAGRVYGIVARTGRQCCVPEEVLPIDGAASASFVFQTHDSPFRSDTAYFAYDPSDGGPVIMDTGPGGYTGLGYHTYDAPGYGAPTKDNVHVVTSYTDERQTGPVYKKSTVTRTNLNDPHRNFYATPYSPRQHDPEEKQSVYKESSSEGTESSSFNTGVHVKKSYKSPTQPSVASYRGDPVVSTIRPHLVATAEPPTILITPKSDKVSLFSTIHPASIEVTSRFSGTSAPPVFSTSSSVGFSDQISEHPLEEASSVGKSFVSSDLDSDGFFGFHGDGYGYDKEKSFEKEKGEHYLEAHRKAAGEKSEKDYKNKEGFSKGEEKKHGSHHHKGSAHEHGGEKKGHLDEGKKYAEGYEVAKDGKETDFLHKKGHRKGHKKSGFHTVHHKDEFKKDEHFFDESHDSGEQSAHGHKGHEHAHKVGQEKKEGHHDSAFHEEQHKKQGGKEEAHSHGKQSGHKAEQGEKAHHAEAAEHAKKEGHKEVAKHEHTSKEGHEST